MNQSVFLQLTEHRKGLATAQLHQFVSCESMLTQR